MIENVIFLLAFNFIYFQGYIITLRNNIFFEDGPYDCRNAARIMYEKILDKSGRRLNHDTSQSRRHKTQLSSKVSMMLGLKYRNKKLDP